MRLKGKESRGGEMGVGVGRWRWLAPGVLFCRRWRQRALARSVLTAAVWFSPRDLSQLINSLWRKAHMPHTHTHAGNVVRLYGVNCWTEKSKESTQFSSRHVCPSPCTSMKKTFFFPSHSYLLCNTSADHACFSAFPQDYIQGRSDCS